MVGEVVHDPSLLGVKSEPATKSALEARIHFMKKMTEKASR